MIKAIIFDCFGVIVGKGFNYTFSIAGGDPIKDKEFVNDMLGQANLGLISEREFSKAMAEHLGKTEEEWHESTKKAEQPDQELLDYIEELKKQYKTALLSNSNKGVLARKIGDDYLNSHFNTVVCSAEVGVVKPDPAIYIMTAERLGLDPTECVFIDDHKSYVDAAEAIGMKGITYIDLANLKQGLEVILSH